MRRGKIRREGDRGPIPGYDMWSYLKPIPQDPEKPYIIGEQIPVGYSIIDETMRGTEEHNRSIIPRDEPAERNKTASRFSTPNNIITGAVQLTTAIGVAKKTYKPILTELCRAFDVNTGPSSGTELKEYNIEDVIKQPIANYDSASILLLGTLMVASLAYASSKIAGEIYKGISNLYRMIGSKNPLK